MSANDGTTPVLEPVLTRWMARVAAMLGPLTLLQALFAALFLWLFTIAVDSRTATYYRDMPAPPSFRHMDAMDLKRVLFDYLDAHAAGPDTVLVLGDCVAFGHGVVQPFPQLIELPGFRLLNISMQSFRYDLMLLVIDEALRRGVRQVLVQLHPFEDYRAEATFWKRLKSQRLGTDAVPGVSSLSPRELIDDAEQNWRVMALANTEGTERFYDYDAHFPTATLSGLLRYQLLSAWPLYRSRFAVDDWSGLQLSYYTARTHRSDSYTATLPESQQREIFAAQADFFARFVIDDRDAYASEMAEYSAAARIASVLEGAGAEAVFMMAPTFVNKIERNTSLTRADLEFASTTMRAIVGRRGYAYLDYVRDAELGDQMVHFDNLTAVGQQMLARRVRSDLAALPFPRATEMTAR